MILISGNDTHKSVQTRNKTVMHMIIMCTVTMNSLSS